MMTKWYSRRLETNPAGRRAVCDASGRVLSSAGPRATGLEPDPSRTSHPAAFTADCLCLHVRLSGSPTVCLAVAAGAAAGVQQKRGEATLTGRRVNGFGGEGLPAFRIKVGEEVPGGKRDGQGLT